MYKQTLQTGHNHELKLSHLSDHVSFIGVNLNAPSYVKKDITTVDVIILTKKEIIIVEAKSITGEVDVDLHKNRTEIRTHNRTILHKINPIKQNLMHAKGFLLTADKYNVDVSNYTIKPIVVYDQKTKLVRPDYLSNIVMSVQEFISYLATLEPADKSSSDYIELSKFLFERTL